MIRALIVIAVLLAATLVQAQQLTPCWTQNDVTTFLVHPGSATLNTASFNFDNLFGTITFKGKTTLRNFFGTNLNALAQFQNTATPDAYFTTFSRTYHESLLAQTPTQVCPLMTGPTTYLETH